MEPFCPFLLAGVSLPLAKALKGNETTTTTTAQATGPPQLQVRPRCLFPAALPLRGTLPLLLMSLRGDGQVSDFLSLLLTLQVCKSSWLGTGTRI